MGILKYTAPKLKSKVKVAGNIYEVRVSNDNDY